MASTLQELRKGAGFRTAKEFAEALDVPPTTYSRYESTPEKIPLASAWSIADKLGCSIDAVVGREEVDVDAMRGDVQKFYDGLSEGGRALMDDFCDFLAMREEREARRAKDSEDARNDVLLRHYERIFYAQVEEGDRFGNIAFASRASTRRAFLDFLREKARAASEESTDEDVSYYEFKLRENAGCVEYGEDGIAIFREADSEEEEGRILGAVSAYREQVEGEQREKDEGVIAGIMEAYDRAHGSVALGEAEASYSPARAKTYVSYAPQ